MLVAIAGFDRSVNPSKFPAIADAVRWLTNRGFECINPSVKDLETMWETDVRSSAYRNTALVHDVRTLLGVDALYMMPGWEQWPEAVAMFHVAKAMKKQVVDLPASAFTER